MHSAPQHPVSWTNEKHSLNCISMPSFASLDQSFPKVKVPTHIHCARALHVHYVPYHEMTCTIELRSLNSISVPNLVSIGQNFLEPEDPSQINFSGPGARSLHLKGTVTTKAYMLGKHTCNLQVCISRAYRVACRSGKRTTGAKHLHVHCTCTMHPSPFLHTAPSRPCQGATMYRVWCR